MKAELLIKIRNEAERITLDAAQEEHAMEKIIAQQNGTQMAETG